MWALPGRVQVPLRRRPLVAATREVRGRYRLGDDAAVQPADGGAISAADYAVGFVDLIENGDHHREQVNLG